MSDEGMKVLDGVGLSTTKKVLWVNKNLKVLWVTRGEKNTEVGQSWNTVGVVERMQEGQ